LGSSTGTIGSYLTKLAPTLQQMDELFSVVVARWWVTRWFVS